MDFVDAVDFVDKRTEKNEFSLFVHQVHKVHFVHQPHTPLLFFKNRLMFLAAWRIRSSFSIIATLTYSSP